jgi:glutathione S-transferase
MVPIFYSFRRCPYAMRARLALKVSGVEVELREILLRDKPQAFLDAAPSATVPALALDDGTVIDESLDIMLWALRQNDPERWLDPETESLAAMLMLVAATDGGFKADLDRAKYPNRYPDADPGAAWQGAMAFVNGLSDRLGLNGGYLFGAHASLADMAILPFIRQFASVDKIRFDDAADASVAAWLEAFLASPLLASVMDKYPVWQSGEPGIRFP